MCRSVEPATESIVDLVLEQSALASPQLKSSRCSRSLILHPVEPQPTLLFSTAMRLSSLSAASLLVALLLSQSTAANVSATPLPSDLSAPALFDLNTRHEPLIQAGIRQSQNDAAAAVNDAQDNEDAQTNSDVESAETQSAPVEDQLEVNSSDEDEVAQINSIFGSSKSKDDKNEWYTVTPMRCTQDQDCPAPGAKCKGTWMMARFTHIGKGHCIEPRDSPTTQQNTANNNDLMLKMQQLSPQSQAKLMSLMTPELASQYLALQSDAVHALRDLIQLRRDEFKARQQQQQQSGSQSDDSSAAATTPGSAITMNDKPLWDDSSVALSSAQASTGVNIAPAPTSNATPQDSASPQDQAQINSAVADRRDSLEFESLPPATSVAHRIASSALAPPADVRPVTRGHRLSRDFVQKAIANARQRDARERLLF